jgi:DNA mismatch repair protein MSH2
VFGKMNSLITELDCYLALAHVAANAPTAWVRPTMLPMGSKVLKMEGARHPCLEAISSATFIPNDVDMVKGESNVQIITGPNMG